MISWLVIPLLWACPGVRFPVLGNVGQSLLEKSPAKPLLCAPSPGAPERFDQLPDALARVKRLGPGASLSLCQPGETSCVLQEVEWDVTPNIREVRAK